MAGPRWTAHLPQPYKNPRMHEVGIMEAALAAVLTQARSHGAEQVHRIVLRIGSLAGVEVESLRFAFDVVTRNTPAERAELEIISVPAEAHCAQCGEDFTPEGGAIFACTRCGALSSDIRHGRELELFRIEMS